MATTQGRRRQFSLRPEGCSQARCFRCQRFKSRPSSRCGTCGDEPCQHNMTEAERWAFDRAHGYD